MADVYLQIGWVHQLIAFTYCSAGYARKDILACSQNYLQWTSPSFTSFHHLYTAIAEYLHAMILLMLEQEIYLHVQFVGKPCNGHAGVLVHLEVVILLS